MMLALIALLFAANPGPAPLAPPTKTPFDVPAPASLEREAVLAWTAKYVSADDWRLLAYDYEGVKLAAPDGVRRTDDGYAEAEVRTELFKPIEISAGTARSGIARWAVDCGARRLAVLRMTIYAGNNLQGQIATRVADGKPWQDPVGSESEAIKAVCAAVGR
jgi:hypothetical protein